MTRRAVAVAASLAAAVLALAPALAAPAAADPYLAAVAEPAAPPAIEWLQMGLSDRIDLVGANQPVDASMPVPAGVFPTLLTGEVGSIVNVTDARVDVLDGRGSLLGTVAIPSGTAAVPFGVDVSAAQLVDGRAKLSFVLRNAGPAADTCAQPPALTLNRLATTFSGPTPAPVTVADYLPGYLDRIVLRLGSTPSESQQQAALDLVAELTRLYRPMPVRIEVAVDDVPPLAVSSSTRVIDLREGGTPGITVENPGTPAAVLAITGTGEQLIAQVGMFADRRIGLAQAGSTVLLSTNDRDDPSSTIKTFDQLGVTGQTTVSGATTLYAGFDAAAFGVGPISGAKVHLKAHYTPVTGGEGSLLIRSGAAVLAARSLDGSGILDVTGDIPAEAVTSDIGLALELRYISRQECAPRDDRVTFALDPQSTVTVTPGAGNRGGFPVLPMAFTPDFDVAVDDPGHLRFAAAAVNLIAQQTQVRLRPRLSRLSDAAASGAGLLVVSGGRELAEAGMNPPLLAGDGATMGVGNGAGSAGTLMDLHAPLGMVQAFTHNGRAVLAVTGAGDWSLVDNTFDHVRGLPDRWGSLTGDVVATGIAGQTVTLSVAEGGSMPHQPAPAEGWQWWAWASVTAVAVAGAAAVATTLLRRRG